MTVHVFFNPELVGQLNACGITARRRDAAPGPATGFVLEGRRVPARAREAVSHVIAVRDHVTVTGPRELAARPAIAALPAATRTEPQTALELVEENERLRRDNQRLTNEVDRLRGEVTRLAAGPVTPRSPSAQESDDTATRFALLELD